MMQEIKNLKELLENKSGAPIIDKVVSIFFLII